MGCSKDALNPQGFSIILRENTARGSVLRRGGSPPNTVQIVFTSGFVRCAPNRHDVMCVLCTRPRRWLQAYAIDAALQLMDRLRVQDSAKNLQPLVTDLAVAFRAFRDAAVMTLVNSGDINGSFFECIPTVMSLELPSFPSMPAQVGPVQAFVLSACWVTD